MISLILLKLFTFSQILQGVPKLLHATVYAIFDFSFFVNKQKAVIVISTVRLMGHV